MDETMNQRYKPGARAGRDSLHVGTGAAAAVPP